MTRIGLYARYSSDQQRPESVEDQLRTCRAFAKKQQGWEIVGEFSDPGISGASLLNRPGVAALLADAKAGKFDLVLSESLDRVSRDLEDIAAVHKRLTFLGIKLWTISEGEVGPMAVGLRGTMAQMFLADLAAKTKRGQIGRILAGNLMGCPYGYAKVRKLDERGEVVRGLRKIDKPAAAIVLRIFEEYAEGRSPREIVQRLDADRIPSPRGTHWSQRAIYGNPKTHDGILSNHIYIGELIHNRRRGLKDPSTGRRVARLNDEADWVRVPVPDLAIVPRALWDKVQAIRKTQMQKSNRIRAAKGRQARTGAGGKYLFSELLFCAECGARYVVASRTKYACSTHRYRGPAGCSNHVRVNRALLEERLLHAIRNDLFAPEIVETFKAHLRKLIAGDKASRNDKAARQELAKVERAIANVMAAVREGARGRETLEELERLGTERDRLEYQIKTEPKAMAQIETFLPRTLDRYRDLVGAVDRVIGGRDMSKARHLIRGLVGGKIVLRPTRGNGLSAELSGRYSGLIDLAKEAPQWKAAASKLSLSVGPPSVCPKGFAFSASAPSV